MVLLSSRSGLIPINPTHPDVPLLSGVSRVRAHELCNRAEACPAVKARSTRFAPPKLIWVHLIVCAVYLDRGVEERD